MKLRKITSLVTAAVVAMSAAAMISMPSAFAATDEETLTFNEDFEGMGLTSATGAAATMQTLFDDGWYPVDNNRSYTPDASQSIFQFATVMGDDTNHYLRINTPNSSAANYKYGLGRLLPGQGTNAKGVWEIDFRFKPYVTGSVQAQFNFGLNTYGQNVDETIAQHNIISAYANKMYMGFRDYMPLYEGGGIPQGRIDGAGLAIEWYDVKVILNCDSRYYSVELSRGGNLVSRRSAISFAGNETIGFFKLSALGMGKAAAVYVDDISIKPAERETLIYNEDFEAFSEAALVTDGITTGGGEEDKSGHSYFGGFTPWRAHKEVGNYYDLEIDPDLLSQVVRLGSESEGSGLIYMPVLEKLADAATQPVRGVVKTSFKIKPETIGASGMKLNAIGDYTQDIKGDSSLAFEIANNYGIPAVEEEDGSFADLDPSLWYNVDLVFNVTNGTAATTVKTVDTEEEIASFVKEVGTIKEVNALKGIMFNVPAGSSVLADDIKIEYYMASEPKPVVGKIAAVDRDRNAITDTENVPTNLWAIQIPFGCTLDPATANKDTITFVSENGDTIDYRAKIEKNSYYIYLDEGELESGTEYQVTVPATVANTSGDELGQEFKFRFKTAGAAVVEPIPVVGKIAAVDRDRNAITDTENVPTNLWAIQIPFGCTLDPATANKDTITFVSENGDTIDYRAKIEKNSYYIYLDEGELESGTEYQVTVPATVANISGDELGQEFKFRFKTAGAAVVEPKPVVGKIAAVDRDRNAITDTENVPTNLWAIQIPFGCTLDPATANKDTITFVSENGDTIDYRAKIEKNSYYIYLDEGELESGTEYQVTVPATVANISGDELGQEFKFRFKTAGAAVVEPIPVVGKIAAVDRDRNAITDTENVPTNLWAIQIPFGCTLDPATANKDTITFVSENGDTIDYRAKIEKNSYYIYLDEGELESGTEYQVTVPATVANTSGDELGKEFKFRFKTAGTAVVEPKPVVGKIAAVDRDRNAITDTENVPTNLWAIQIPFGCTLDPATANKDTITFVSENGDTIDYRAKIEKNSYYIYLDEGELESGTEYQVTVPPTVANTSGDELGQEFKFRFKTMEAVTGPMRIRTVKVNDKAVESLSDITAGSTISVITDKPEDVVYGTGIAAFYGKGGKLVKLIKNDEALIVPGESGADDPAFTIDVPQDLDMADIGKVSIFLWDGFDSIKPYCAKVSF